MIQNNDKRAGHLDSNMGMKGGIWDIQSIALYDNTFHLSLCCIFKKDTDISSILSIILLIYLDRVEDSSNILSFHCLDASAFC